MNINELLDISDLPGVEGDAPIAYQPLELVDVNSNVENRTEDLAEDYSTVRRSLHYQQQMIMDMAKICLETAKNSESPRFVEVFTGLMGQFTNSSKELVRLHKDMKDITDEKVPSTGQGGGININNANVIVGSPTDIMDQLGDAFEAKEKRLATTVVGEQ